MSALPASLRPDKDVPLTLISGARSIEHFASLPRIPPLLAWVVYACLVLAAILCAWAVIAKVDVIVIGQGRLIAPRQQVSLQVYETSVVKSIYISIGQFVKKGQILGLLDPTFTNADRADYQNQVASLKAALERCQSELSGKPYNPARRGVIEEAQLRIYSDRKGEREAHIESLVKKINELKAQQEFALSAQPLLVGQLALAREEVDIYQKLVDKALGERHRLVEAKMKELEARSKLAENQRDRQKFEEQISGAIADRDSYISEWFRKSSEEYEKGRIDLETAVSKLAKAQRRDDLISMVAPMDASVLDIPKRNVGSVLREGEILMTLVPADASLLFDVALETRDVAHLQVGQEVRIKFEALPYQQYGSADGTLRSLTFDTTTNTPLSDDEYSADAPSENRKNANGKRYYRAEISIDRRNFRNLPPGFEFRPGMKGSAEVKVGLRTVAEYVLHPILRVFDESLREK
jgi:hemolysin D